MPSCIRLVRVILVRVILAGRGLGGTETANW